MELRYVKNGIHLMPQYKGKSGDWKSFKQDQIEGYPVLKKLTNAIASMSDRRTPYYSNTKEAYFHNEVEVMAFLGGIQAYFRDQETVFEIFLDNSE